MATEISKETRQVRKVESTVHVEIFCPHGGAAHVRATRHIVTLHSDGTVEGSQPAAVVTRSQDDFNAAMAKQSKPGLDAMFDVFDAFRAEDVAAERAAQQHDDQRKATLLHDPSKLHSPRGV